MELFKRTKKQPIKLRNFKYIGNAQHYPNIVYYYKELLRDNFEIMTCALEGTLKKPEIGAGTNVKVIDVFMANYLYNLSKTEGITYAGAFCTGSIYVKELQNNNDFVTKNKEIRKSNTPDIIKIGMEENNSTDIYKYTDTLIISSGLLDFMAPKIYKGESYNNSKDEIMSKQLVEQVLEIADFVKFAKAQPLGDDNIRAFEAARCFVEDTKPVETDDEKEGENDKNANSDNNEITK